MTEGDEKEVARAVAALLAAPEKLDGNSLPGEDNAFYDEKRNFLFRQARSGKEADTNDGKRENFLYLSQPLIKVPEAFGANQTLSVDYCPLAQVGNGVY